MSFQRRLIFYIPYQVIYGEEKFVKGRYITQHLIPDQTPDRESQAVFPLREKYKIEQIYLINYPCTKASKELFLYKEYPLPEKPYRQLTEILIGYSNELV